MMRDPDLHGVAAAAGRLQRSMAEHTIEPSRDDLRKVHDGIGAFVPVVDVAGVVGMNLVAERDAARKERDEARGETQRECRATERLAALLHKHLNDCRACPAWVPGYHTCYGGCERALIHFAHGDRPLDVE